MLRKKCIRHISLHHTLMFIMSSLTLINTKTYKKEFKPALYLIDQTLFQKQ